MLYNDVCGENLENTLGVLRACQLGHISDSTLNHAIDNRGEGVDVAALVAYVKSVLPGFGVKDAEAVKIQEAE
ncbi:MAG: hypothetical protein WA003_15705 [Desulfuromonadaceae bacterium]